MPDASPFDLQARLSPPLAEYLSCNDVTSYTALSLQLTSTLQSLARDADYRQQLVGHPSSPLTYILQHLSPSLWSNFTANAANAETKTPEQKHLENGSAQPKEHHDARYRDVQLLILALRCCRNAMARSPTAQQLVAAHLTHLEPIFVYLTAFTALTHPDLIPLSRTCGQLLCNLITFNPSTQQTVWQQVVLAPSKDKRLVHRLLTSPDTATQMAAQILLINQLKLPDAHLAHARCLSLCTEPAGLEIVEMLLNLADSIILQTSQHPDDDDDEFGAYPSASTATGDQPQQLEESLRLINEILTLIFTNGATSTLLRSLAPLETIGSDDQASDRPIVNASQMTLLKLLDSWLHFSMPSAAAADDAIVFSAPASNLGGLEELVDLFLDLSRFVRTAMAKGLQDHEKQDKRVVGVHQVLLLVLQCLLSLGLVADGWSDPTASRSPPTSEASSSTAPCTGQGLKTVSRLYLSHLRSRIEVTTELVSLLHQTYVYAPPISPFKLPATPSTVPFSKMPEGHALSSTGISNLRSVSAGAEEVEGGKRYGFDHLKRDIVRVLGTLVYSPVAVANGGDEGATYTAKQVRTVQDQMRECGGLWDVMNMTVLDERNPYMREHAIFTLHYLLAGNLESQDLVKQLQPLDQQQGGAPGGATIQLPFS